MAAASLSSVDKTLVCLNLTKTLQPVRSSGAVCLKKKLKNDEYFISFVKFGMNTVDIFSRHINHRNKPI